MESSRRQDKQAELFLAVARLASNLTIESVVHSVIAAAVRWLEDRASMVRVWVLRNPSVNQLSLHSSYLVSTASDTKLDRQVDEMCGYNIVSGPGSQSAGLHSPSTGSTIQPSKFVMACYSKREKVHVQYKEGNDSATAGASHHRPSEDSEETSDVQQMEESIHKCEWLCLPILFPTKENSLSSSGDGSEKVWGVLELQAVPGQLFTTLDMSLMSTMAVHAGTCLAHAETKTDSEARTNA